MYNVEKHEQVKLFKLDFILSYLIKAQFSKLAREQTPRHIQLTPNQCIYLSTKINRKRTTALYMPARDPHSSTEIIVSNTNSRCLSKQLSGKFVPIRAFSSWTIATRVIRGKNDRGQNSQELTDPSLLLPKLCRGK